MGCVLTSMRHYWMNGGLIYNKEFREARYTPRGNVAIVPQFTE